jgi:hypothetical protein
VIGDSPVCTHEVLRAIMNASRWATLFGVTTSVVLGSCGGSSGGGNLHLIDTAASIAIHDHAVPSARLDSVAGPLADAIPPGLERAQAHSYRGFSAGMTNTDFTARVKRYIAEKAEFDCDDDEGRVQACSVGVVLPPDSTAFLIAAVLDQITGRVIAVDLRRAVPLGDPNDLEKVNYALQGRWGLPDGPVGLITDWHRGRYQARLELNTQDGPAVYKVSLKDEMAAEAWRQRVRAAKGAEVEP